MPLPEWAESFNRYYDWLENSEGLTLICKRCGNQIVFTNHAKRQLIIAATYDHWTSKHGYTF